MAACHSANAQTSRTIRVTYSTNSYRVSFSLYVTSDRIFEKSNSARCGSLKPDVETKSQGVIYDVNGTRTETVTCSHQPGSYSCSDGRQGKFQTTDHWSSTETRTLTSKVSSDEITLQFQSSGKNSTGESWSGQTSIVRISIAGDKCVLLDKSDGGNEKLISSSCSILSGRAL